MIENSEIKAENNGELDKVYNETVKNVTERLDLMYFNTTISQLMIFVNAVNKAKALPLE